MPPAAEMKQVDDDSVRAGGSVDVASHHPGACLGRHHRSNPIDPSIYPSHASDQAGSNE